MDAVEIIIPISFFISVVAIAYFFFYTRNKERLALIENGADAKMFQIRTNKAGSLKVGMFLVGIALGIITAGMLDAFTTIKEEIAYFSMMFLFGGSSLILYYYLNNNKKDEEA